MNHSQRQSELNAVGGNTMAWMSDRTRADDGDEPAIVCPSCGEAIEDEYDWIDELKMCKFCYSEEYGHSWGSHDEAENKIDDR